MIKLRKLPELPLILLSEKNDIVSQLLEIIHVHQYNEKILKDEIQRLSDAVAQLQRRPKKPRIKPSPIKETKTKKPPKEREEKKNRVPIHREVLVKPETIPEGAVFKGYRTYLIQDIEIKPSNTLFKFERWKTREGAYIKGSLPPEYEGCHFGPKLKAFILYQYYQGRVTQPRLLKQLKSWNIEVSAGELNHLLCTNVKSMEKEENNAVVAGLKNSSYVQTDDTGARHKGKNCASIHIGNHLFTHFTTSSSKSRLQFLEILNRKRIFTFNDASIEYLKQQGTLKQIALVQKIKDQKLDKKSLEDFFSKHADMGSQKAIREAGMLGTLSLELKNHTILSDGAKQYQVLEHASCWIHAMRLLEKEKPLKNEKADSILQKLCFLYHHLKRYKKNPSNSFKRRISKYFDQICDLTTGSASFEKAVERFHQNKKDLLRVLTKPEIPLHNNLCENDLREYVTKRKISFGTRSDLGRLTRDTYLSLMKTCAKIGVTFWDFLLDRMSLKNEIAPLSQLIIAKSC